MLILNKMGEFFRQILVKLGLKKNTRTFTSLVWRYDDPNEWGEYITPDTNIDLSAFGPEVKAKDVKFFHGWDGIHATGSLLDSPTANLLQPEINSVSSHVSAAIDNRLYDLPSKLPDFVMESGEMTKKEFLDFTSKLGLPLFKPEDFLDLKCHICQKFFTKEYLEQVGKVAWYNFGWSHVHCVSTEDQE